MIWYKRSWFDKHSKLIKHSSFSWNINSWYNFKIFDHLSFTCTENIKFLLILLALPKSRNELYTVYILAITNRFHILKKKKCMNLFQLFPLQRKKMHGHFMNWRKLTAGALDSFPKCLQNGRRNIWAQNVVMLRLIKQNTTSIVFWHD